MSNKTTNPNLWQLAGFKRSWLLALFSSLPAFIALGILLYAGNYDTLETITILALVFFPWLLIVTAYYFSALRPWQSVASILMSFREQDYSLRAKVTDKDDVINIVLNELNFVSEQLNTNRLNAAQAEKLLARVLSEVDVAVLAFDQHDQLVICNRYAANLYNKSIKQLIGCHRNTLQLNFAKLAAHASSQEIAFPRKKSRWLVKHSSYRQQGLPYQLILLADIGNNLREEELEAWRKLIRILSHEINNALTPLKTTVGSMNRTLAKPNLYDGWQNDFSEGLDIIDTRINNLNRLVNSYTQLAKQPEPVKQTVAIQALLKRICAIYQAQGIKLICPTNITLNIDECQIEQVLVNLIKNAIEANVHNQPIVVSANEEPNQLSIQVDDHGIGIENPNNIFIPYFTTKSSGNGIGLVLSRQIIEAHGGSLTLENHQTTSGCRAKITLPS
ncbi:sensor histidine kinase [Catenovulum agarivorans]|uniref:sensor histidine kinase n=1 Tax=Catenovulum agarivorans TaxID=1172192 RepID=UPI0003110960|nr:ATP-binding protein [Catenovulum agarivorans]